jgi:pyridoxal/pyridoxine/pyridoxamine kinase
MPEMFLQLADFQLSYVGNKMASIVMQSLGCDVSAINTVHYSEHAEVGTPTKDHG